MECMKSMIKDHPTTKNTDKPAVEVTAALIPPLERSLDSDDNMSLYVEKARSNRLQQIEDGKIYTIRLGMHNRSVDVGAFARDTVAACFIPTTISKRHRITAFFTQRENFPAVFMDDVILKAATPVKLEYVKGSAALESNCAERKIWLDDGVVTLGERIMIITGKLDTTLPECCTYTYDFITFQVKVAEEQDYYIQKEVRKLESSNKEGRWGDSVTARVGDRLEFRVTFANSDTFAPEIMIADDLPECLKFIKGTISTYTADGTDERVLEKGELTSAGLAIKDCAPEAAVVLWYAVEIADCPLPHNMDRVWDWINIRVGSKNLEDYAEVIIK